MTFFTNSDKETEALGCALARALAADGVKRAFIAMRGEMGVGKTAFVRGFAAFFGISGVKSPTYTVVNEYVKDARVFHFDMYRITDEDDLYSIGYDDYIERDGYCIVEWSENIENMLPEDAITVSISRADTDSGRRIDIDYDNVSL